jgi:hypothetical protein
LKYIIIVFQQKSSNWQTRILLLVSQGPYEKWSKQ